MAELESTFRADRSSLKIMQSVLFALFMREMQTRFGARRMGIVWVVLEPLAILSIILTFYSFFHAPPVQGLDFVMYMVSGIVPFHMMRSIAWRLTDAVPANVGLFSYRQVTPFDAFLVRTFVEVCVYFCSYVVICSALGLWLGHDVLIHDPAAWLWAVAVGILLSFSIGIVFALIAHAAPSMGRFLRLLYFPIYITSGIFYPIWRLPNEHLSLMAWNPYVEVVNNIRLATFENYPVMPDLHSGYPLRFSLILLLIAMAIYRLRRQELRVPV